MIYLLGRSRFVHTTLHMFQVHLFLFLQFILFSSSDTTWVQVLDGDGDSDRLSCTKHCKDPLTGTHAAVVWRYNLE